MQKIGVTAPVSKVVFVFLRLSGTFRRPWYYKENGESQGSLLIPKAHQIVTVKKKSKFHLENRHQKVFKVSGYEFKDKQATDKGCNAIKTITRSDNDKKNLENSKFLLSKQMLKLLDKPFIFGSKI